MSRRGSFEIYEVEVYGLRRMPYFCPEESSYVNSLFIKGEICGNFPFIVVCNVGENQRKENKRLIENISKILSMQNMGNNLQSKNPYDSEHYVLQGGKVKALVYCGDIIAIGNNEESIWIPTSDFFSNIEDLSRFKEEYIKETIKEHLDQLYESIDFIQTILPEIKDDYIRNNLDNFSDFIFGEKFNSYYDTLEEK